MFTEKGWENIFLLSGGLETFNHYFKSKVKGELAAPPAAQEQQHTGAAGRRGVGSANKKGLAGRPPIGPKIGQANKARSRQAADAPPPSSGRMSPEFPKCASTSCTSECASANGR